MRKTAEEHKRELVDELLTTRRNLLMAAEELPPLLHDQVLLGIWTIKDLLAHLIGWDFTNLQAIQQILAGQYPTFFKYYDKDWQSYNARLVLEYRVEARPSATC